MKSKLTQLKCFFLVGINTITSLLIFSSSAPVKAQPSGCGSGATYYLANYAILVSAGFTTANFAIASRQFRTACEEHDVCYDTYGKSQQECDKAFHNRMLGICASDHNTIFGKVLKIACNGRADTFYSAVRKFGKTAYDKAQANAKPVPDGRKFVKFRNKNWGRCLNMQSTQNQNGGLPNVWECVSHPDQEWKIEDAGNGFVKLRNKNWNRCLNMQSTQNQNGGLPNVWECVSHPDQEWKIEDV
jgi:hypothetical protein